MTGMAALTQHVPWAVAEMQRAGASTSASGAIVADDTQDVPPDALGNADKRPFEPVSVLLRAWSEGSESALEQLLPLVEAELRRLARAYMSRERRGHTLQVTALSTKRSYG